jgi:hypothetical protein
MRILGRPLDSGINQEPHLRLKRNLSYFIVKNKKHSVYHSSATYDIIIVIYYKYRLLSLLIPLQTWLL